MPACVVPRTCFVFLYGKSEPSRRLFESETECIVFRAAAGELLATHRNGMRASLACVHKNTATAILSWVASPSSSSFHSLFQAAWYSSIATVLQAAPPPLSLESHEIRRRYQVARTTAFESVSAGLADWLAHKLHFI